MSSIRKNKNIIVPNAANYPTPWSYSNFPNILNRSTNVGIGTSTPSFTMEISSNIVNTINTNLYYEVSGTPINNSFYPGQSNIQAAVSEWISSGGGNSNRAVAWSPQLGLFAVASNTANINSVYTSPNGFDWTARTTPAYGAWDIVWAPYVNDLSSGCFLGVSTNGVMRSTDGITWDGSNNIINANDWVGLAWSQEIQRFVAVARSGTSNTVMVSSNGLNWTAYNAPLNAIAVCWAKELGLFAAIATSGGIMVSSNGINWRVTDSTRSGINIIWSSELGMFLASANSGNVLYISRDGVNWQTVSTPVSEATSWSALSFSPQLGAFVVLSGPSGGPAVGAYSTNGITWNRCGNFSAMRRMTWSPELGIFVAVVNSGTRIQVSSMKGRPPTPNNIFDSSYNNINELGMWSFRSFGRNVPVVVQSTPFTVTAGMNWLDISGTGSVSLVLPTSSAWPGLELNIRSLTNRGVTSSASNVFPINSLTASSTILATSDASGSFVNLVSGGSAGWYIMQKN